jgi:hypothetical protein
MNNQPQTANKITIEIRNNRVDTVRSKKPVTVDQLLEYYANCALHAMLQTVAHTPDEYKKGVTGALYDMYNVMASQVLERFAPELELRPNLTSKAILEAENAIVMSDRLGEVELGT